MFTGIEFPKDVVPMPAHVRTAHEFERDARGMQEASMGFVHWSSS